MHRSLKNVIALLSILALLSPDLYLLTFDNMSRDNADATLAASAQLCCCGNDMTACTDCCCSKPDSGTNHKGAVPIIAPCACNQDDGSLCQKVDYVVSTIACKAHFPFMTSLTSTVVILEYSPSNQLYKPPRV